MLALRIRPATADAAPAQPPATEAPRHGWSALVETAPPYGFAVPWARGWIAGESVGLVDAEAIRGVAEAGPDLALPANVLGLVVVDAEAGRVVAASSIRSARPYYLHLAEGTLTLATSLRTLRALGVALQADPDRFGEVLVYRCVAAPNTLCRNVRRLVGGEVVTIDLAAGGGIRSRLPVFPAPDPEGSHDEKADLDHLHESLLADLRMQVEARRRPGILLSGGLDSGLLAALGRHAIPHLESWSSSFDFLETGDAEATYAQTMADALGVRHHVHQGTAEAYLESLVHGVARAEMPLHHLQSGMLDLLFAEAAAAGHDALISGEAADGLFGSIVQQKIHRYRRILPWVRRLGLGAAVRAGLAITGSDSERWSWFALGYGPDHDDPHHLLWSLGAYGDPGLVQRRFGFTRDAILGSRPLLDAAYRDFELSQQVSIVGLLIEGSVTMEIWGRLAEAHGLALPCPFAAPETIDTVARIPWPDRVAEPKHHVRALLRREGVPEALIERPKLSFGLPYRHWALPGTLFQPLVDQAGSLFDPALLRSVQTERWNEAMVLWSAIGLYLFQRLILDDEDPAAMAQDLVERHRARVRSAHPR